MSKCKMVGKSYSLTDHFKAILPFSKALLTKLDYIN